jgi:hypothetical protein
LTDLGEGGIPMKKLLPFVVVMALLALLLVVTVTVSAEGKGNGKDKDKGGGGGKEVICHQPGTPVQKTMEVPAAAVSAHLQHGDTMGPCVEESIPAPSPSPTDTITATVKVTICHKPGTPAEKTLALPEVAVPGHLGHGDYLGSCLEEPMPSPTPPPTDTITATVKVTICHKPGTPAEQTLALPEAAIPGHLRHGDYLGPCLEEPVPSPTPPPSGTITATVTVTICHKPGTPAEMTLELPETAVFGHLRHGDYLGVCGEAPPEFAVWLMPNFWWQLLRRLLPV